MLNKLLSYLTPILVVVVILLLLFGNRGFSGVAVGGDTNFDSMDVSDGYKVDGTSVINGNGVFVGAINGTQIQLDSGTTFGELNCATATWNPDPIATSTTDGAASVATDIALSGAAMGDMCWASLTSATSPAADVRCNITGTATSTIILYNIGNTTLDVATGTARVCYFGF